MTDRVAIENFVNGASKIRRMFEGENSSDVIRHAASSIRKVLDDQTGEENVLDIVKFIGFYLTDPRASATLRALCEEIKVAVQGPNNVAFKQNLMTMIANLTEKKNCEPFYVSLLEALNLFARDNPDVGKVTANFKRLNRSLKLTIKANRRVKSNVSTRSLNENPLLLLQNTNYYPVDSFNQVPPLLIASIGK